MKKFCVVSSFLFCLAVAAPAFAGVDVADPWVRATVSQQRSTGAFMTLRSDADARLIGVASPAAEVVEIHEMKMDGDVMRMGAVDAVELPAGQVVELKPGSFHVMLTGLVEQAKEGDEIPLTLTIETAEGETTLNIEAEVRPLTHQHGSHHGH